MDILDKMKNVCGVFNKGWGLPYEGWKGGREEDDKFIARGVYHDNHMKKSKSFLT